MDPMGEEQLDYGDDDFASPRYPPPSSGGGAAAAAIPAVADDENDDEFDDLYSDVNVGESFAHAASSKPDPNPVPDPHPHPHPLGNGSGLLQLQLQNPNPNPNPKVEPPPPAPPSFSIPVFGADQNPNPNPNPRVPEQLGFRPPPVGRSGLLADPGGPTMLFVGELHWWTTDAEVESAMSRYGRVKEVKFFDERASGKSKGYCQVEFYDAVSAAACKEGMDGYQFNGRACVVAFASPQTLRQMGASHVSRNQGQSQQGRRQMNDASMGGGWTGEEHGKRTRESSYGGDGGGSEYGYGDERGGRPNVSREKERGSEHDWSGNSERRPRDEKEQDWERSDRDQYRGVKDGHRDHRSRDRDYDEDDRDRGQSSSRSRSRMMQEDDHRSRSRDTDYGKRRRLPSE